MVKQYHVDRMREIKTYVDLNFAKKEPLEMLLQKFECYVSIQTARRIFKQLFGIGFYQYRSNLVISESKKLLKETDLPIKQIFPKVGYSTKQSFLNAFSKHVKTTPGKFRKIKPAEIRKLPEDVFAISDLDSWAVRNGYSKELALQ